MHLVMTIIALLLFATGAWTSDQSLRNVRSLTLENGRSAALNSSDHIVVLNGKLFVCSRSVSGSSLRSYDIDTTRLVEEKVFEPQDLIRSWQLFDDTVVGFESGHETNKVLYFNDQLEVIHSNYAGLNTISELGVFSNGNMIVYAQSLDPRRVTEEDVLNDFETVHQLNIQGQAYESYMAFLVDEDFTLISPLVKRYKGLDVLSRETNFDHVDVMKYGVQFRLNHARSFAAVFNRHRGDITFFSMQGQKFAEINRTHAGMIPEPDRFPVHVPEGEKVWYQSDILLDGDLPTFGRPAAFTELFLYVSEPGPQKLEVYKITGLNQHQFLGTFTTPFPVMRMVKGREGFKSYLYMVDRDGGVHRSDFPNPDDLAPAFKGDLQTPKK